MLLSDQLITNYKKYLDGEKKNMKEFQLIFKTHFIHPCLKQLMEALKGKRQIKLVVEDFKRVKNATDFLSTTFPAFKKGWFTNYMLVHFTEQPELIGLCVLAEYK